MGLGGDGGGEFLYRMSPKGRVRGAENSVLVLQDASSRCNANYTTKMYNRCKEYTVHQMYNNANK
jgi:hypothetical protein